MLLNELQNDVSFHVVKNWWDKKSIALAFITKAGSSTTNFKQFSAYDDSIFEGFNKEEIIGYTIVKKSSSEFYCTDLNVDTNERRKGYATKLYDHIEKVLKITLSPEFQQTEDGQKFWNSRK